MPRIPAVQALQRALQTLNANDPSRLGETAVWLAQRGPTAHVSSKSGAFEPFIRLNQRDMTERTGGRREDLWLAMLEALGHEGTHARQVRQAPSDVIEAQHALPYYEQPLEQGARARELYDRLYLMGPAMGQPPLPGHRDWTKNRALEAALADPARVDETRFFPGSASRGDVTIEELEDLLMEPWQRPLPFPGTRRLLPGWERAAP